MMMKQGKCPICGSTEVYTQLQPSPSFGGTVVIELGFANAASSLDNYLCTGCGFFEVYVSDAKKLEAVRTSKKWKKV